MNSHQFVCLLLRRIFFQIYAKRRIFSKPRLSPSSNQVLRIESFCSPEISEYTNQFEGTKFTFFSTLLCPKLANFWETLEGCKEVYHKYFGYFFCFWRNLLCGCVMDNCFFFIAPHYFKNLSSYFFLISFSLVWGVKWRQG